MRRIYGSGERRGRVRSDDGRDQPFDFLRTKQPFQKPLKPRSPSVRYLIDQLPAPHARLVTPVRLRNRISMYVFRFKTRLTACHTVSDATTSTLRGAVNLCLYPLWNAKSQVHIEKGKASCGLSVSGKELKSWSSGILLKYNQG